MNTFGNFLGQGRYAYDIVASVKQVKLVTCLFYYQNILFAYFGSDLDDSMCKSNLLFAHPHENVI